MWIKWYLFPGRCARMNVRRLFVNLDTKKAFDSVEWPYLFHLLESYGFGSVFISWVRLLYTEPMVRLWINCMISGSLFIFSVGLGRGVHCHSSHRAPRCQVAVKYYLFRPLGGAIGGTRLICGWHAFILTGPRSLTIGSLWADPRIWWLLWKCDGL